MLGIDWRTARHTWTAAVIMLALLLAYLIRQTVFLFVVALLFAYLLYPLMDLLDHRLPGRRTRNLALVITFVLVIALLGIFVSLVGSVVVDQANALAAAAPSFLQHLRGTAEPGPRGPGSIWQKVFASLEGELNQNYDKLVALAPQVTLRLLSASASLIYVIVVPILAFFILKDGRQIRATFLKFFEKRRHEAEDILSDIHILLLQYMRALLLLCCATFISFSIVLSAMGVPFAVLLASVAFLLEFIPLVGPLAAAAIILGVSIASGFNHVLWLFVFLGCYRLFQDYVLSPNLMSQGVELHPLLVIFGVFAGGEIGGVAGVFLSIPILALIRLLYHRLRKMNDVRWAETNVGQMRL